MAKKSRNLSNRKYFLFPTIFLFDFILNFYGDLLPLFLLFFLCCSVYIVWKLIREEKGTYKSIKVCLKSNFILFFMEIDFDLSISARTEQILFFFFLFSSSLYNPSYIFLCFLESIFFFILLKENSFNSMLQFFFLLFFISILIKKKISFKHNHLSFSVQLNNKI